MELTFVNMEFADSFRALEIYKLARKLAHDIFVLSYNFPKKEMFSLTDQVRRSSRSIGAQIAEAWAKRSYEKHFIGKLSDADGEHLETQHWIETALDCQYITPEQATELNEQCQRIGRMLYSMMDKAPLFAIKAFKQQTKKTES
jgi:four helix bundle protein